MTGISKASNESTLSGSDGLQFIRERRLKSYRGLESSIKDFRTKVVGKIANLRRLEDSEHAIHHLTELQQFVTQVSTTFRFFCQRAGLPSSEDGYVQLLGPPSEISENLKNLGRSARNAFDQMDRLLLSKGPEDGSNTADHAAMEGWNPLVDRFELWRPNREEITRDQGPDVTHCQKPFWSRWLRTNQQLYEPTLSNNSSETGKIEAQIDPKNNHNSNSGSTETQALADYFLDLAQLTDIQIRNIGITADTYTEDDIFRVEKIQKRDKESLVHLTTISTIISAVTATTLQISLQTNTKTQTHLQQQLYNAANALWFCSLSLSISAATNTILDLFRRSYINRDAVPHWILFWIRITPRVLLGLAVLTFEAGLCMLSFAFSQPLVTSIVTSVLTVSGSLTLALLFAGAQIPGIRQSRSLGKTSSQTTYKLISDQRNEEAIRSLQVHPRAPRRIEVNSEKTSESGSNIVKTQKTSHKKDKGSNSGFELLSGFSLQTMRDAERINRLAFSPDGRMLVCFNDLDQCFLVKVSNLANPRNMEVDIEDCNLSSFYSAIWFPDSKHLLLWKCEDGLWILRVAPNEKYSLYRATKQHVPCIAITHAKGSIAFFSPQSDGDGSKQNRIVFNDVLKTTRGTDEQPHSELIWVAEDIEAIQDMSLTADDKYLLCAVIPNTDPPAETHIIILDVQTPHRQAIRIIAKAPLFQHLGTIRNCNIEGEYLTLINNQDDNIPQLWELKFHSEMVNNTAPLVWIEWKLQQAYYPAAKNKTPGGMMAQGLLDRGSFAGRNDQYVVCLDSESKELHIWDRPNGLLSQKPLKFGQDVTCFACTSKVANISYMIAIGRTDGSIEFWGKSEDKKPKKTNRRNLLA